MSSSMLLYQRFRMACGPLLLRRIDECVLINTRCLSCSMVMQGKSSKPPQMKPPGKVQLMAEKRYVGFMERMERTLEKRSPRAHKLYMLIKQGIKDFFTDSKTLYRVSTDMWKGKPATEFSYSELEVYRQMPHDMVKVAPVLAIAALPFAPYVIFPIAYLFPRHLLCRHFWTPEQSSAFNEYYLKSRVPHYPKILHYMEKHCRDVKDQGHRRVLEDIIHKLEQKRHPSVDEILAVKPVFADDQPFGRAYLVSRHKLLTRHLAKSMGFSTFGNKLSQQALLLHHIDCALHKEGVPSLNTQLLKQACFLRGLNASEMNEKDMQEYLQSWTRLSQQLDDSTLSLLLHSPTLLAMNHRANSKLLHKGSPV